MTLEAEIMLNMVFSLLMICSGMVRDVGATALAVSSTIRHGSVSSSFSRLLMILS